MHSPSRTMSKSLSNIGSSLEFIPPKQVLCKSGSKFPDKTTRGKVYPVTSFQPHGFRIINDDNEEVFPIDSVFTDASSSCGGTDNE